MPLQLRVPEAHVRQLPEVQYLDTLLPHDHAVVLLHGGGVQADPLQPLLHSQLAPVRLQF